MKYFFIFFYIISFHSFGQDDKLIYLHYLKFTDTINIYCVNKNPVDYYIHVQIYNNEVKANPNNLKKIIKANDSTFVTQLTSKYGLNNFASDIVFYKKPLIEIDSIQAFKDFKTPIENFIKSNKLIVFTKKNCPACSEVTNFLNLEKLPSNQIDINNLENAKKYEEVLDYFQLKKKNIELPFIVFEEKPYYQLKKKEKEVLFKEILEKLKSQRYSRMTGRWN